MTRTEFFRPGSWRLATRMVAAAIMLLAVLLAVVVATHTRVAAERRQAEFDHAAEVSQAVAAIVDGFARDLEATILSVAVIMGDRERPIDQETAGPALHALREEYGLLRALFVTDEDGRVIASDSGVGVGVELADRPYMQALIGGAPKVWSAGILGIESGEVIVSYGRAMYSPEDDFRGYVIAAFYPPRFVERLMAQLPADAAITLIDQTGFVLHSTQHPDLAPEQRQLGEEPSVRAALDGAASPLDGSVGFFSGEERFGAVVPVAANGWAIAFTRPLAPLESALQRELLTQIGIVTVAVAMVAGLLIVIIHRLTRPLAELARAAGAVARGERPRFPVGQGEAEVRQLAQSMELMSAAVAEREDELRRESERRTVLAETSRAFAEAGLNLEIELGTVAHRACDIVGDGCAILLCNKDGRLDTPVLHHRSDAAYRRLHELVPRAFAAMEPGIAVRAFESGQSVLLPRVSKDEFRALLAPAFGAYVEEFGPHCLIVQPMRAHGRLIGVLVIWRDQTAAPYTSDDQDLLAELSERAALAIENARLFREVSEHAVAVDRAMHAHRESVAMASHDLKNPLATIRASAQWVRRELERGRVMSPERLLSTMQAVEGAAMRATEEIDGMLEAAALQSGESVALALSEVDLIALMRSICEEFQQVTTTHEIVLDADDEDLPGEWDAPRLERAFENLLNNAIKYSPDGGEVLVQVHRERADGADRAVVQIHDQGVGIPAAALTRIFDRLYRAENVEGRFTGNGLGLTGVRYIVEAHGGTVEARSTEGQGSTFTVRLPCRPRAAAQVAPAIALPHAAAPDDRPVA